MYSFLLGCFVFLSSVVVASAQNAIPVYSLQQVQKEFLTPHKDTAYVVNFWATWCKPCIEELPAFDSLHAAHKNIKVILVSLDKPSDSAKVRKFLKANSYTAKSVILKQPSGLEWIDSISKEWSGAIPITMVVPPNKGTYQFYEQSFTTQELFSIVSSYIQTK